MSSGSALFFCAFRGLCVMRCSVVLQYMKHLFFAHSLFSLSECFCFGFWTRVGNIIGPRFRDFAGWLVMIHEEV